MKQTECTKRRHKNFRRRGITEKKEYKIFEKCELGKLSQGRKHSTQLIYALLRKNKINQLIHTHFFTNAD